MYPQAFGLKAGAWLSGGMYGASLGGTLWTATHKPKEPTQTYNFDQMMNQISSDARIPIIYGQRKFGGYQTYHKTASDKQSLIKDIIFCEGEIDSISDVRANDLLISSLSGCSYDFHNGSPTQSPPDNYTTVGGYKNCAWLRANLKVSEQLQGGNPTVTAVIKGTKVLDTRTNQKKYSSNPALCVRDYLLSKRYGAGHFISEDMLDEDSFQEVADYCDELVTTRVPTTLATYNAVQNKITELQQYLSSSNISQKEQDNINDEITRLQQSLIDIQTNPVEYTLEVTPRYSLNIIITEKKSHVEILQDMFAVFGGFLVFTNNKVALRCEKATPVSYAFNDDNIVKDSISYTQYPIEQSSNRFSITFYDPNNQWTGVKVIVDDSVDQKERGKIINKDITLNGCTSQSQALRLGRLYRDKIKLCSIVAQWQTGTMAMHLEPGDVVTLSKKIYPNGQEQWLFQDMPFRILEISEDKGVYTIKAEQYNESIYNDTLGAKIQVKNYVRIPDPFSGVIPDVTSLTLSEYGWQAKDGTHISTVECSWDESTDRFFRYYILSISTDNLTWTTVANTLSNSYTLTNVQPQKYYVKVQVQNSIGRLSTGVIQELTVTGKDNPPRDVESFKVIQQGNTLVATVLTNNDPDFKYYELREGITWDTSSLIGTFIESKYVFLAERNGTRTFLVKAKDNFGNYSVNASISIVDISGIQNKNIIYTNDFPFDTLEYNDMKISNNLLSIQMVETLNNYYRFFDMFNSNYHFKTNASIELPVIDLGYNIIDEKYYYIDSNGNERIKAVEILSDYQRFFDMFNNNYTLANPTYKLETLLGVNIDYNTSVNTNIEVYYKTSLDGIIWSNWNISSSTIFFGRYLKIKLIPKSNNGITNVDIKSINVSVDVPDITVTISNVQLTEHLQSIQFNRNFFIAPTDYYAFTTDANGTSVSCRITNITNRSFDIQLFDSSGTAISGVLKSATFRGY